LRTLEGTLVAKMRFVGSNASFSLMLFYTQHKPSLKPPFAGSMWPAKMFRAASDLGCSANNRCGNAPKKIPIFKQLQTHFEKKHEKGVGTPFQRVPAPLVPCPRCFWGIFK